MLVDLLLQLHVEAGISALLTIWSWICSAAYIVEVEAYYVGSSYLKQTRYKDQVDTRSSFTYFPSESYEDVISEVLPFDS